MSKISTFFRSPVTIGAGLLSAALLLATTGATAAEDAATPLADADTPFSISVENAKAKVGETGAIMVTISAAEGYKCNESYPHKVRKLKADDGAELEAKMVKGAVKDKKVVIPVNVKATKAGTFTVTGQIKFSVCNDSQCVIKKAPLKATITAS